jgi:anti-sigma factor RsiW
MGEHSHAEQRLLAYLNEELDPGQREAVEAELARDAALRGQLEELASSMDAAREWFALPVPGSGRADRLQVPRLSPRTVHRKRRLGYYPARVAALAATFIVGVAVGSNYSRDGSREAAVAAPPQPEAITQQAPVSSAPVPAEPATLPHYTTDETGRLIIQTVSHRARATWVVDGSFELAQSAL